MLAICFNSTAQTLAPFKKGDRVVFTGNSITDGGHYHSYIWLYYITRFPNRRIDVFNAGIGGDVAQQMYERLQSDVFVHKPTVVTLGFGMNDTGYQFLDGAKADSAYDRKIEASEHSFNNIARFFNAHRGIRYIMLGSSPYDGTSKIKAINLYHKNLALQKLLRYQKQQAERNKWPFIDFNRPMQAINEREQQRDTSFTMEGFDRIHPTNDGHMVMAYLFLTAQGLGDKKVADITIDSETKKLQKVENCTISKIQFKAKSLTFNYLAKALPYPIDTLPRGGGNQPRSQADALKLIPFTQRFNQELLTVTGLNAQDKYQLSIDDIKIGEWSGESFAHGINLAILQNTPQYQQALAIMHLNEERWALERKLREYYWIHYSILKPKGLLFNNAVPIADSLRKYARKDYFIAATLGTYNAARFKAVRNTWLKEIKLITDQLYTINKPVVHTISVMPAN
ncbi:SGNH/GDSL hydrolase family protein [Mucilaginibacter sp. CSA2-8R]|uniref:SGNH/GDSL hydrolase family protein n=1 Tax=Mucilaginibacter sp. CSA2-8R TaxID=3141542 RepID=UPI00315CA631